MKKPVERNDIPKMHERGKAYAEPRMSEGILRRDALVGIQVKQLEQQVHTSLREERTPRVRRGGQHRANLPTATHTHT